jgi:Tfp pilus assembly protein PilV
MRTRALSLIEVIASLVLIGGVVTALITMQARSLEQVRASRNQQTAAALAQELIVQWKLNSESDESPAQGRFDAIPGWRWERHTKPYVTHNGSPLEWTSLTITCADVVGPEHVVATFQWLEKPDDTRTPR